MTHFRSLVRDHARLTLVLLALALAVKALVPAGFMLSPGHERFVTVTICADALSAPQEVRVALPPRHDTSGEPADAAAMGQPCAFAGLGLTGLGAADPVLLTAAIAFVLLTGLGLHPALPQRDTPFLRPHQRGPPAIL